MSGPEVTLEIGGIAHGGHCVARHEGRVVFVRHTLPGERVLARLTEAEPDARYWRADAVEVLQASSDRVPSPWPEAGAGGVGGAELAHVSLPAQRRWKAAVISEQMKRLARLDTEVTVEEVPGAADGLHWRTRIELVTNRSGQPGMHRHRSREVIGLSSMPLAVEELAVERLLGRRWPAGARLTAVAPQGDRHLLLVDGVPWTDRGPDRRPNARTAVRESADVAGRQYTWRVAGDGFWQVHRGAPAALAGAVLDAVGPVVGEQVVDLYSGAGLFAVPLADEVGPGGRVVALEGDARAAQDARRNLHDRGHVDLHLGGVRDVLASGVVERADVVVLDPPRVGAGRAVIESVAALAPRRVVYVACDPAALARDVGYLGGLGYPMSGLRAFDLFPMTHHVECVATFDRGG